MKRARTLLIMGIWVAILPYLGFPRGLKNILFALTGFALMYFAYALYREARKHRKGASSFDNFRENTTFSEVKMN